MTTPTLPPGPWKLMPYGTLPKEGDIYTSGTSSRWTLSQRETEGRASPHASTPTMVFVARLDIPGWVPCPPAEGGRWPTEADEDSNNLVWASQGGEDVEAIHVEHLKEHRSYIMWHPKQKRPAPFVPPEPEKSATDEEVEDAIAAAFIPPTIKYNGIKYVREVVEQQASSGWVENPAGYVEQPAAEPDCSYKSLPLTKQPASEPEKPKRAYYRWSNHASCVELCDKKDAVMAHMLPGDLDPDDCLELVEQIEGEIYFRKRCGTPYEQYVPFPFIESLLANMRRTNDAD